MGEITGYRVLNANEIAAINYIKVEASTIGDLIEEFERDGTLSTGEGIDRRWLAIAKTQLQQGFMALVRAVAQPKGF